MRRGVQAAKIRKMSTMAAYTLGVADGSGQAPEELIALRTSYTQALRDIQRLERKLTASDRKVARLERQGARRTRSTKRGG